MVEKKPGDPDDPAGRSDGRPGTIVHEANGKTVWKWSSESDSTSKLLKKLDIPGISIDEGDAPAPKSAKDRPSAFEGYSPYGETSEVSPRASRSRPAQPKPGLKAAPKPGLKPALKPAPKPAPKRGWFGGLFRKD
jgi:hypothetical protein